MHFLHKSFNNIYLKIKIINFQQKSAQRQRLIFKYAEMILDYDQLKNDRNLQINNKWIRKYYLI